MQTLSVAQLIPVLQTAIGPTILISGVGLLLLTMTNRLARTIDRTRAVARELPDPSAPDHDDARRTTPGSLEAGAPDSLSIALASLSALFAAILIIVLVCDSFVTD